MLFRSPYFGNEKALASEFFASTPKDDYTVVSDSIGDIVWDIDDDGMLDDLYVEQVPLSDEDVKFNIMLNNRTFTFDEETIPFLKDADIDPINNPRVDTRLFFTENGVFLMVRAAGRKAFNTFVFKVENGEVTYCDAMDYYERVADYSANDLVFAHEEYPIGWCECYQDYKIGADGKFQKISENFYCFSSFITKMDLSVTKLDDQGYMVGETTLPAGSRVILTGYNKESQTVCLEIETKDGSNGERVLLDMSTVADVDAAFTYVFHGE